MSPDRDRPRGFASARRALTAVNVRTHPQASQFDSPWCLRRRVVTLLWELCWGVLCRWTPKPFNAWRLLWLRAFGCSTSGRPFVHQRARIHAPWNLVLHDRACLGDRAHVYSLDTVEIGERATVAQEAYLCTGTHAFERPGSPLQTGRITVGADAFVGARAFVLPGIAIGDGAVIGACAVVTRDVAPWCYVAGNPARRIRSRKGRAPVAESAAPGPPRREGPQA